MQPGRSGGPAAPSWDPGKLLTLCPDHTLARGLSGERWVQPDCSKPQRALGAPCPSRLDGRGWRWPVAW